MSTISSNTRRVAIEEKYLPGKERTGAALCLSGGGYRAALFHLGVCRRLNELGLLAKFKSISAVSGGSIFAAHLARRIHEVGDCCFTDYEGQVAGRFRQFVKTDIRTSPAFDEILKVWNAAAGSEALARKYEEHLVGEMTLADLPPTKQFPAFIFSATDLSFGVDWVFSAEHVGDYQGGYMDKAKAAAIPLAKAVAASSCFPPVFRPMPMNLDPSDLEGGHAEKTDPNHRHDFVRQIALSDGGVYDNMGLEPVWKSHKTIFVSDGGKPFRFSLAHDPLQQLHRIHDVMADQAEALRKRWLVAGYLRGDYSGAYLGIRNCVSDFPGADTAGYSKDLAVHLISNIRTDMDKFSDDEIAVLENHGYTLVDAAYKAHACPPGTAVPPIKPPNARWWPLSATPPAEFETQIRMALADSGKTRILGH